MLSARSFRSIGWIPALVLVTPVTATVAQSRPLSVFGAAGGGSVSGSLAHSAKTVWTLGLGAERRVAPVLSIGAEFVVNQRGANLTNETFTSGTTISFSTIGLAPIARIHFPGPKGSIRPFLSSGVLLWKTIGCSVDYNSDFDSGVLTEPCGDYNTGESENGPLEKLSHPTGATMLVGIGFGNARLSAEVRAERMLSGAVKAPNSMFAFGNTVSLMARFCPDIGRRPLGH